VGYFLLTSGTLFDNMKIGPRKLLMAIVDRRCRARAYLN
jgi:hypothetical protein